MIRTLGLPAGVGLAGACGEGPSGIAPAAPVVDAARVTANVHNVLSAAVMVRVRGADSVAVRVGLAPMGPGGPAPDDSLTPAVPVANDSALVPVLGLLPASRYTLRPVVYGAGTTATGDPLAFTTDPLPADLPSYAAGGVDPTPGFVAFAAPGVQSPGHYAVVIDNAGRVVWYRRFPDGVGLNFMAQPTGRWFARPPTPDPGDVERWTELDALGNATRSLGCAGGLPSRLHDLIAERDGSYWLLCDETRTMDLAPYGGVAGARVTGTAVQHISADGALRFHWSPFDHLAITDGHPADRIGPIVNWTHGNALDLAPDGNLVVSFRNLGEVTKIDSRSGAVVWRLGGPRNQFAFVGAGGAVAPAFVGQHSARAEGAGTVLLLDNLGDPIESRAERYLVDEATRTARLVDSYGDGAGVVTQIGGSVQSLPDGRTLVSFGTAGRVVEYDASGRVVWRIEGNAGYVFRAQRIRSLYAPGRESAR